jgi:hypothetical protein
MSSLKELTTINTYNLTKIKLDLVVLNIIIFPYILKLKYYPYFILKKGKWIIFSKVISPTKFN